MKRTLLSLMLLVASLVSFAHDFEVDGIYYNILSEEDLTCEVAESPNENYTGSVVIPEQVSYAGKVFNVTSIGSRAFYGCSGLTSISIPNSVTSIGRYAFYECKGLTSITIPNSVTSIGNRAFYQCKGLTSITLPNSVTSIGERTFYECTGLTSVTLPNSVTNIGDRAFEECKGLTSVTIGNGVTSIGNKAFAACTALTDVTSLATTPPTVSSSTFSRYGILHVLPGCKAAYEATAVWNEFTIVEDATDGIEGITADTHAADARKFLQNGRLFIRKNGKTYNAAGMEL